MGTKMLCLSTQFTEPEKQVLHSMGGGSGGQGRGRWACTGAEGKMLMAVREALNSCPPPPPPPPTSIRYPDELPFARLFDPDVEPKQGQLRTGQM